MPVQQIFLGRGAASFGGETLTYSTKGTYTSTVHPQASSLTVKVWGAGGAGTGEPSGTNAGGAGGHVEGTISVSGGDTINVYVGGSGDGSKTSPYSQAGYGAGNGGGLSGVKYGSNIMIAGGGGGAGQGGSGGGGGGNGGGGPATGDFYGQSSPGSGPGGSTSSDDRDGAAGEPWNNGSRLVNGGNAGGSGVNQGNRGGGGGAGYYGGGGGSGYSDLTGSGSGGGAGSGVISGSWSNTVSQQGGQGPSGAQDSGDPNYVSGRGGSGQDGLVVLIYS